MTTQQPILCQSDSWRIYWYDEAQTIIVCEILNCWTWNDASASMMSMNEAVRATPNTVDVIIWFTTVSAQAVPRNAAFSTIRRIMAEDVPNENSVVMIQAHRYFEMLMETIKHIYSLLGTTSPYYYVSDFEAALTFIAAQHEDMEVNES